MKSYKFGQRVIINHMFNMDSSGNWTPIRIKTECRISGVDEKDDRTIYDVDVIKPITTNHTLFPKPSYLATKSFRFTITKG